MMAYVWPLAMVVVSNVIYQICAKSVPQKVNPFASLTVTYLVAAAVSFVLFRVFEQEGGTLIKEYSKLNWSSFVLGLVIIGLETGWIFAYKAGWQVSKAFIVQSSFLAAALLVVGAVLYHEGITWNKAVGIAICLIGLIFINAR